MLKANNLGDVPSITAARANLDVMSWAQSAGQAAQAAGGLIFDGLTNPHQVLGALTGQNIGSSDFTIWLRFRVPAAAISGVAALFTLSDDGTGARPRAFMLYYDTSAHLYGRLYGATTSDSRTLQLTNLRSEREGQVIDLALVRNSSGLSAYVNGTQWTATSESTAGSPPVWTDSLTSNYLRLGAPTASGATWAAYRAALFNCALIAADVDELTAVGIPLRYKWGSQSELIANQENRNFNGGSVGNWEAYNGATLSNPDNKLCVTLAGSGASGARLPRSYAGNYRVAKRLRLTADIWKGTSACSTIRLLGGGAYQEVSITETQTTYTAEFTTATTGDVYVYVPANSDGGTFYVDNVSLVAVGAVADLDLTIGKGDFIPDRTSNRLWAEKSPTAVSHKYERQSGEFVIAKTLAHSDISATGESTVLFSLPANCSVLDVEFDRETAFDSGTTLSIGVTGNNAKYASAANVAATGKLLVDSASKASESATASTTVYIKKNQATTQGLTTVRARCVVRG